MPKRGAEAETEEATAPQAQKKQKEVEAEVAEADEEVESDEGSGEEVVEEDDEDYNEDGEEEDEADQEDKPQRIWRPGVDEIMDGEQLDFDPSNYVMFHRAQAEWPCLSFDVLRDELGAQRTTFPMTTYIVAGTQATKDEDNRVYMMKWSSLYKTSKDGKEDSDEDDDDEESDDDEDGDHEAQLTCKGIHHPGGVNRIRALPQAPQIVATWADTGKVHMWNLDAQRKALDKPGAEKAGAANAKPIYTSGAHKEEGFALDFSPHETGRFLSGSNDGQILLWEPIAGGWNVGKEAFSGHVGAVEDVQWKRHGNSCQTTFASCGVDRSVRVWDVREKNRGKAAVHVPDAHAKDVNTLSWSPCVGELLATGADDGSFKVWDTRSVGSGPMANFLWHRKPVCSIDWHPTDDTTLAACSEDNCVSVWDMAVEDDAPDQEQPPGMDYYPAQLIFVHQGQKDPKEVRWHPQMPGVCISTAGNGFNIFKPCNL